MTERGPRRTREHILEDLSELYVRSTLPVEWNYNSFRRDYGLDLRLEIVAGERPTAREFSIQLKGTDSLETSGDDVVHRCKVSTAHYFLERREPVIYLVYDDPGKAAYWLWVQAYLRELDRTKPAWRPGCRWASQPGFQGIPRNEAWKDQHTLRRKMMSKDWKNSTIVTICLALVVGCAPRQPGNEEVASARMTEPPEVTGARPSETLEPATLTPEPPTATPEATSTATQEPTSTATPTAEPHVIPFPDPPYELGDRLIRPADGMVMVYVPGGTFEMGSYPGSEEWGPHTVTVDGFWIDQTEVTNAQFAALMNIKGNPFDEGTTWVEIEVFEDAQIRMVGDQFEPDPGMDDHPVVEVSWPGAYAYCEWVGGRLLTEAEWEYAARGPENHLYPWGNEEPTCELAQFAGCGDTSAPVGSLSDEGASWAGAKDMAGNVWEWTADYLAPYPKEPQVNPTGPETLETGLPVAWMNKVSRGGSFGSSPDTLHMAYRKRAGGRQPNLGFRCAADAP